MPERIRFRHLPTPDEPNCRPATLVNSSINWLHLTDWHVGLSAQGHLWPNLRGEFERDLREMQRQTGPIDLVFITGDLVQSGERRQFHELEQNLKRLWSFFETSGSHPLLV